MCRDRKRTRAVISGAAHPDVIATIRTYCFGSGRELAVAPVRDGVTDLTGLLDETTACVYVQHPNFLRPAGGLLRAGRSPPTAPGPS